MLLFYSGKQSSYYGDNPNIAGMNMLAAWDITTGDPNPQVVIPDTSQTNHPDLAGRWVGGYDFVSASFSNDGDDWDADPRDPGDGDINNNSVNTWDCTHVAGIFGANGSNGKGIAGVNWHSKIVPVRVLGAGGGFLTDVADAMRWAAGIPIDGGSHAVIVPDNPHPARIISLSLGAQEPCDAYMQDSIDQITAIGGIFVVAAGNNNGDTASDGWEILSANLTDWVKKNNEIRPANKRGIKSEQF